MKTSEKGFVKSESDTKISTSWIYLETISGIPIWFLHLPYAESVFTGVMVRIGSRDEKPEEAGMSHATEHMMFQGTKKFANSKALAKYIELVGGYDNANTSEERTFYYNRFPAKEAERGFVALSEMMRFAKFPPKKIKSEMKNIVEELRMYKDNPDHHVFELFQENVYGAHPLGKLVIGTKKSVLGFKQENFLDFVSRYYNPANFTIIVVGNISHEKVLELSNKYFPSDFVAGKKNIQIDIDYAKPLNRELVVTKDVKQSHVILGCTTTKAINRDYLILNMFKNMISGGMSFPLFQEVRDKKGLCYRVAAYNEPASDLGCFFIYVGTSQVDKAMKAILDVIQKSKNSEFLLKCAKKLWLGRMALRSKDDDSILENEAETILYYGKPRTNEELIERINSVTIEDVVTVVDKYLTLDRMVMTMIVPKK
jgi:predicted Zn-dependent peptidase